MTEFAKLVLAVDSMQAAYAAYNMDKMTDSGKKAESGMSGLEKSALAAGAALSVVVASSAALVKTQIDSADAASKAASAAGVSVSEYTRLSYALKLGVDGGGDLSQTFLFLNKAIASGSDAFDQIGVATRNADGSFRSADQVMLDVSDKFRIMEDGATKTAIAVELFGRSGDSMIPVLNGGSQALREAAAEADRLGVTIDTNTAVAAENFNDNLTRLESGALGFGNSLMSSTLPALNGVAEALLDDTSALNDTARAVAAAGVAYVAATIAMNAKVIALRAATLAQTAFNTAAKANPYAIAAAGLGLLVAAIYNYNKEVPAAVKKTEEASTAMSRFDVITRSAADAILMQNRAAAGMTMPQIKQKIDEVSASIGHLEILHKRASADFERGAVSAGLVSTYDAQLKQKREQLEHLNALLGEKQKEVKSPKAAASPTAASAAAPKDNFDYGAAALNFNSIDAMAAEEEASAAAYTAARMERLNTQFMTEREAELARYTQQLDDFRFFAEQKGLAEAETNARIEEMQLVHGQNMAAISSKNSSTVLTTTLAGLQGIAGAFAGHSKTMFKVMKAASIAQGLLSIKTGIANAMALPFPANLAAAATVAAQGAGIMADIRSLTDSGGGGKGITAPSGGTSVMQPGMSGGSAIINQTAPRQQTTDIRLTGIRPDDMISGSYLQKIIEGIGETLADNGGRMGKVELVTA